MNTAVVEQVLNAITSEIATELGANYKELAYIYNVEENNFRQSKQRFGVRPLEATQLPGVTKYLTHIHTFEVVLTEGYTDSAIGDSKIREKVNVAYENAHKIYNRLVREKGGLPLVVLDVTSLNIQEPELLTDDKVLVLRANVDVQYRISLI